MATKQQGRPRGAHDLIITATALATQRDVLSRRIPRHSKPCPGSSSASPDLIGEAGEGKSVGVDPGEPQGLMTGRTVGFLGFPIRWTGDLDRAAGLPRPGGAVEVPMERS